jgi:hypothetical protein
METPTLTTINPRVLRAKLKLFLDGQVTCLIGNAWGLRAILIPIPSLSRYSPGARRKAIAEIRRRAKAAINSLTYRSW